MFYANRQLNRTKYQSIRLIVVFPILLLYSVLLNITSLKNLWIYSECYALVSFKSALSHFESVLHTYFHTQLYTYHLPWATYRYLQNATYEYSTEFLFPKGLLCLDYRCRDNMTSTGSSSAYFSGASRIAASLVLFGIISLQFTTRTVGFRYKYFTRIFGIVNNESLRWLDRSMSLFYFIRVVFLLWLFLHVHAFVFY